MYSDELYDIQGNFITKAKCDIEIGGAVIGRPSHTFEGEIHPPTGKWESCQVECFTESPIPIPDGNPWVLKKQDGCYYKVTMKTGFGGKNFTATATPMNDASVEILISENRVKS